MTDLEAKAREIAGRYTYRIAPDVDVDDFVIDILTALRSVRQEALVEVARTSRGRVLRCYAHIRNLRAHPSTQ